MHASILKCALAFGQLLQDLIPSGILAPLYVGCTASPAGVNSATVTIGEKIERRINKTQ